MFFRVETCCQLLHRVKPLKKVPFPLTTKAALQKMAGFFPQRLVAEGFEGLSSPFKKDLKQRAGNLSTRFFGFKLREGHDKVGSHHPTMADK